ncbi:MAG: MopE-related protein, partial [Myxococcota bacterium]|nr:MopE-related protein [Myxococcota bacterium]
MSRLPSCSAALLIACGTTGKPADPPMDADGDGFEAEEDCDDADPAVNPAAQELCNGLDDDCDGAIDIDDPDVEGTSTWSVDSDGDGFGDPTLSADGCVQPEGTADNADDCDDRNDAIHPAADETCDGVDNDCDGAVDAADEGVVGASAWAPDVDGDGFGDPTRAVDGCEPPEVGWVNNAADCDDDDPLTHPAAVETCGDGADSDCDGFDGPARFDGSGTLGCAQVWWDGADGVSGLGTDVAAAGDVDGDGLSDVVAVSNGAAWLFTAISAGGGDSSGAHIEMAPLGPGGAVAAGDLNGDAHVDVVVGDPVVGEVYLLSGSPDGGRFDPATGGALPLLATLRVPGAGGDVAVIPDHGGTGVTTVVVAGPGSDSAWMFSAPFVGVMDADMAVAEVVGAGGGITVAAIGDVDGDGKADLLAGDPEAADGDGRVLVVRDHVVRRE